MNTTATILKAARDLISKPENWTQGAYARNKDGREVSESGDDAFCFCSYGALYRASDDISYSSGRHSIEVVRNLVYPLGLVEFNDKATHSEVLELFSKAIKAAEGEQS